MIGKRTTKLYIDGTSALKPAFDAHDDGRAAIIPFPGTCATIQHKQRTCDRADSTDRRMCSASIIKQKFYSVFASSEMLCSLLFEDVRGCPYRLFTNRNIVILSVSMALIATASLAFGC